MAKGGPEVVSTSSPAPLTVVATEAPIYHPLKKSPSQFTLYKGRAGPTLAFLLLPVGYPRLLRANRWTLPVGL